MAKLPQRCLAELIGTFLVCFVGVGVICTNTFLAPHQAGSGLLGIALAQGFAVAVAISALGRISGGHFNPAVSASTVLTGHLHPVAGLAYVTCQVVGGVLGSLLARCGFSQLNPEGSVVDVYVTAYGGVPLPYPAVTLGTLLLLEGIGAFMWVLTFYGTALEHKPEPAAAVAIGLIVALNILVIGPITGACLNPARAVAAAIATFRTSAFDKVWTDHWAYWFGPIVGGLVGGLAYKSFFHGEHREA